MIIQNNIRIYGSPCTEFDVNRFQVKGSQDGRWIWLIIGSHLFCTKKMIICHKKILKETTVLLIFYKCNYGIIFCS